VERKRRRQLDRELELRSQQFLLVALAPRTASIVRPSAFLGLRGVVALTAVKTLVYASGPWLGPRVHRWSLKVTRTRADTLDRLRRELGREPTDDELYRALASARRVRTAAPAAR
jgi:hypothetical protein